MQIVRVKYFLYFCFSVKEIDFLILVAASGAAAYIGSWKEGAMLLFLFSLGHGLENYAMNKAKKSIEALGIVAVLIPSTLTGLASIGIAVAIHEGSTLIVVINALRLLKYKGYNLI